MHKLCPATADNDTLESKYGTMDHLLGTGSYGKCFTIKEKPKLVVKEFRKFKYNNKNIRKKVLQEYCIGSLLHHMNIVETFDIIFDKHHAYEIMELCPNGDLLTFLIHHSHLTEEKKNNMFLQLLKGVSYLHENGICHRDLKPENCLLDENLTLKIADFGTAEVIVDPYSGKLFPCHGVCGSTPYIAPEEFSEKSYNGFAVDIWACGIIYVVLFLQKYLWDEAISSDKNYKKYIETRSLRAELLPQKFHDVLIEMLEPEPDKRITISSLMDLIYRENILHQDYDYYAK